MRVSVLFNALVVCLVIFSKVAFADTFIETVAAIDDASDGVSIDNAGNVYASSYTLGTIYKIDQARNVSVFLESGNAGPAGMRFDANGNMYVAMYNLNQVVKVLTDGTTEVFANIQEPIGLGWDSEQNLYVSSYFGSSTITKLSLDGEILAEYDVPNLIDVSSVALDGDDNIYVTSYVSGDIYKILQNGEVSLFSSTGAPGFGFLQFDKANNLSYASITRTNELYQFDENGAPTVLIQTPSGGVQDGPIDIATVESAIGIAVSEDGKSVYFGTKKHIRQLYFADPTVDEIRPYFTSTPASAVTEGDNYSYQIVAADPNNDALSFTFSNLPSWLTFDEVDLLSGVPSASDAGKTYEFTITASDGVFNIAQQVSITVASKPEVPSSSGGGGIGYLLVLLCIGVFRNRI